MPQKIENTMEDTTGGETGVEDASTNTEPPGFSAREAGGGPADLDPSSSGRAPRSGPTRG